MPNKTFYIIDGHAQIYRAYFAPFRDLSSSSGEPTKATFVFTQWLINLAQQRKPDYLAMVIDLGDETVFRKTIYPQYKANRESPPGDFHPQEQRILQIVRDAGVPIFVKPGFEADDLLATMTKRLESSGWDVVLVSKDKDLRQLIDDHTRMYDMQSDTFTDAAKMQADLGYGPHQAVEVQTLIGDSTDNVPGIPGVGPKTAAKLINQYGTADAVLEHLSELTPKMRENFEKFRGNIPLARSLVTLRNDVEMVFDPEACAFAGLNVAGMKPHLATLGFHSLLKRLGDSGATTDATGATTLAAPASAASNAPTSKAAVRKQIAAAAGFAEDLFSSSIPLPTDGPTISTCADCEYEVVTTVEQFEAFLAELRQQTRFAFDTETDALGATRSNVVGFSFSWKPKTGFYVPIKGPSDSTHLSADVVSPALKPILEDPAIAKVGHNIKYDLLAVRQMDIHLRGISLDTMVAAFVLDAGRMQYGIDRLALEMLHFRKIATEELIGKGRNQLSMERVSLPLIGRYAAEDADITLRLADMLEAKLAEAPELKKLLDDLETPLIDVLAEMEHEGIAIDPKVLAEQSVVLGERIEILKTKIAAAACCEFNPDSPKQLADVLFKKLGLKVVKRNKTGPSTDVEVLEKLADLHECPRLILEYRSLVKLKNTYLDNLTEYVNPRTGRVHASFNQIGAATGRLSCSDPNLQNIPIRTDEGRRIRLAFVPGDAKNNVLLTADYSQIELRMLAHFTKEPALLKAFEADEDIHRAVAAEVFGVPLEAVTRDQRGQAKTINFGIIYGVTAFGLSRRIEGLNVKAAQKLIDDYATRFPAIEQFMQQCVMAAKSQGYVETILGRRRPIVEINSAVLATANAGERMAINSVVQGSAADLIKVAMLNVHRRLQREKHPAKMLLQVHDELVFETPASEVESTAKLVREEMTGAMKLLAPLKVEIGWGKNWQEVK